MKIMIIYDLNGLIMVIIVHSTEILLLVIWIMNSFNPYDNILKDRMILRAKYQLSIPNFLGLNIYENAIYLRNTVFDLHSSSIFLSSKNAYKASIKMEKFTKSLNKCALKLDKEFEEGSFSNKKVKNGLICSL